MANQTPNLTIHWRATTSRLLLVYGVFFIIWGLVLIGLIYWETLRYLDSRTDAQLKQQIGYLRNLKQDQLLLALNDYVILEKKNDNAWGLLDAKGNWLKGGIGQLPPGVQIDGQTKRLLTEQVISGPLAPPTRVLSVIATRMQDGNVLILAHTARVAAYVSTIILHALGWGISFTLVPGLLGGLILNRAPRRRIRQIESTAQLIMRGNLRHRLPVGQRDDELDRLAAIVNNMLDQIERLMGEVKGVCDNIAHDLRTPLTRLRSQLYRVEQTMQEEDPHADIINQCVCDIDEVLARFRALLRISELEDRRRREGFVAVDLGEILERVYELYAPLAEDRNLQFELSKQHGLIVQADPDLLFEAISNLAGNAVKFTQPGGCVQLLVAQNAPKLARIEVIDNGPGIPEVQRQAVWQRFYRGEATRGVSGHGLGLSIVAAVAKVHGFELHINGDNLGTRMSMDCPMTQ